MSLWTVVLMVLGLGGLLVGAELLVRGASRLAASAGLSPLVIGLTVVAFGTSAPELAVSVGGALSGTTDVALGNVVGSNSFNVLFILGLSALLVPLTVASDLVRRDVPLLIGVSALVLAMALDGGIGRIEGLLLAGGLLAYTVLSVRSARRASRTAAAGATPPPARPRGALARDLGLVVLGLVLLAGGARGFVEGAVELATALGLDELVIGVTIVAIGTSLPEVAASVVAGLRGERDIAVGNVVGSCLFNLLGVLGVSAVISPIGIPVGTDALHADLPVMVATALACLPIFVTGARIDRWEGALFLGFYVLYTVFVVLRALGSAAARQMGVVVVVFVLPLTVMTLLVAFLRDRRAAAPAGGRAKAASAEDEGPVR